MTHDELVQVARRWLSKTIGCTVVLTELVTSGGEVPDAIGWKVGQRWSWLVECKTSRADFRADIKKPFRAEGVVGFGQERYYLTEADLLKPEEIPSSWGLLEWDGKRVRVRKPCPRALRHSEGGDYRNWHALDQAVSARELPLVLSALRRKHCSRCEGEIDQRAERRHDDEKDELRRQVRLLRAQLRAVAGGAEKG